MFDMIMRERYDPFTYLKQHDKRITDLEEIVQRLLAQQETSLQDTDKEESNVVPTSVSTANQIHIA